MAAAFPSTKTLVSAGVSISEEPAPAELVVAPAPVLGAALVSVAGAAPVLVAGAAVLPVVGVVPPAVPAPAPAPVVGEVLTPPDRISAPPKPLPSTPMSVSASWPLLT